MYVNTYLVKVLEGPFISPSFNIEDDACHNVFVVTAHLFAIILCVVFRSHYRVICNGCVKWTIIMCSAEVISGEYNVLYD